MFIFLLISFNIIQAFVVPTVMLSLLTFQSKRVLTLRDFKHFTRPKTILETNQAHDKARLDVDQGEIPL